MTTDTEIKQAISAVARSDGASQMIALRALAIASGAYSDAALKCTEKELQSLYFTTLKRIDGAREIAAKINRKYGAAIEPSISHARHGMATELDSLKAQIGEVADNLESMREDIFAQAGEVANNLKSMREDTLALAGEVASVPQRNKAEIAEIVAQAIKDQQPVNLTVTTPSASVVPIGLVHEKTEYIIRTIASGLNIYLHGPAGSGKTTVALKVAQALGVQFYFAAKVESEYLLLGFTDASGKAVRTQFREAYEHGGLFLFDELDASSPSAIVALNAALANGFCPFPDGTVQRHPDFHCIAAGNTVLTGASRAYSGRVQMDAASIDRFFFIEFGYDEKLERALATNTDWCDHVQAVRRIVKDRGLNHLVTPRATLDGCKALAAGHTWQEVETGCIFKGLDADTVRQIQQALPTTLISAGGSRHA